jgi:hypothetical protein
VAEILSVFGSAALLCPDFVFRSPPLLSLFFRLPFSFCAPTFGLLCFAGDYYSRWSEFLSEVTPLVRDGRIKHEETVMNGFEKLPEALAGLFKGINIGKVEREYASRVDGAEAKKARPWTRISSGRLADRRLTLSRCCLAPFAMSCSCAR